MFNDIVGKIKESNLEVYGIEYFKDGHIIGKYDFAENKRYPIYSATKSFLGAAVGIAVKENKFDINYPLTHYLTEKQYDIAKNTENLNHLHLAAHRIYRFLTMSVKGYPFRPEGDDWEKFSLAQPVQYLHDNECEFHYSNITAYLVGIALENAVGENLIDYLTPRLFEPLGIKDPTYKLCPNGHFYGASGMELTVHELSLLGELYLNLGKINGKQIFSEDWARESISKQIDNKNGGYGYFMWYDNGLFKISGKWGQKCIVDPKNKSMVTYLSNTPNAGDIHVMENYAKELLK